MGLLRPCTTSAGFTTTGRQLDLAALRQSLPAAGFQVVLDARVLLLVRKGVESSLYATGKVLLKTADRAAAESAFAELQPLLAAASR